MTFFYCIVYKYLYSASHGVSQTEALSVHFSSKKKVRLKARERRGNESRENKRAKSTNSLTGPYLGSWPQTRPEVLLLSHKDKVIYNENTTQSFDNDLSITFRSSHFKLFLSSSSYHAFHHWSSADRIHTTYARLFLSDKTRPIYNTSAKSVA